MGNAKFYCNCVGWPSKNVPDLIDMIDSCKDITYATFRRNVDTSDYANLEKELGYHHTFRMHNDWSVGYYKSVYLGRTAYYFKWSAIEYVFLKPETEN